VLKEDYLLVRVTETEWNKLRKPFLFVSLFLFWVVTPCGFVGRYQQFREHTVSIFRAEVCPKRWYLPTSPHGIAAQKTNMNIITAVRTSYVT
jgi:hypothetical protein